MKKYPIYIFSAKWSQKGIQDIKYPNRHKGLPEGYIWNSTGFNKMFKEYQTEEQLKSYIENWWDEYKNFKFDENQNIDNVQLNFQFLIEETFVCTWFTHECFDEGQTDEEFLNEFEQYVQRHEYYQDKMEYKNYKICLMGAEDRWRWNSGDKSYNGIPCRCQHCKEQGLLRISH